MGCHFLLQGIFPTQGSKPGLPHCRQMLYHLSLRGSPLLGILPKETRIERDTCTSVFTAAQFTIARTWKQPRCPSAEEWNRKLWSVQFSSVSQSCPTLCEPMNCSMPGLPVHLQLPEFTQTHVHRVGDGMQPSQPLSSPSPPASNPSQHQSLFQ